jgi:outer membrane protein OmpA-like peptidoglycan-associated protein/uncharacterized protein YidB (DUF937 family)
MFDVLLKELATRLKLGDRAGPLLTMLLSLIFDEKRGGFAGFTDRFRANNMGELLTSWLGNGENRSLTLSQLESVLGNNVMQQMASRLDLSTGTVSTALGQLIPTVIDKLSPDGKLPTGALVPDSVRAYLNGEHAKFSQIAVLPEVQASKAAAHTLAHAHAPKTHNWAWLFLIPILCAPLLFMRGCDKAPVGTMPATGVNPISVNQDGPVTIGELQPPGEVVIQSEPIKPKIVSDAPAPVEPVMTPAPAEAALDQLVLASTFTTAELTSALNLMVVYFDSGKSSIKDVSLPILQKAASAINKAPVGIELIITGHTDSRGPEPENVKLSLERAQSVIAKLTELGVDISSKKLTGKGLGSSEPVASNENLEGRAKNRRIVFSIK